MTNSESNPLSSPPRLKRLQNLILRHHVIRRRLVPNRHIHRKVLHAPGQTRAIQRKQRARDRRKPLGSARRNRHIGGDVAHDVGVLWFTRRQSIAFSATFTKSNKLSHTRPQKCLPHERSKRARDMRLCGCDSKSDGDVLHWLDVVLCS